MKKITLLTLLTVLLAVPIMLGQTLRQLPVKEINKQIFNAPENLTFTSDSGRELNARASQTLTQNSSQTFTNFLGCNDGVSVYDTSVFRAFDLAGTYGINFPFTVSSVEFGVFFANGTGPKTITVNVYSTPGPFPGGVLTLQGTADRVVTSANNVTLLSQPVHAVIPAGELLVYEVFVGGPDGANYVGFLGNTQPQTAPTYWRSAPCGAPNIVNFGGSFAAVMNVVGAVAPIIACPSDIMQGTDPGVCGGVVNFANAIAIDPEGGPVTVTQTMGPASGSVFPVGDTVVEFTATDQGGDSSTCQFTVTIFDDEVPTMTCPDDITVENDPGVCGAIVEYPDPLVVDNCFSGGSTTTNSLTTLFNTNNNGALGGAVYFDVTIGPNDIEVTDFEINTAEGGAITMNVYTLLGTYVGNQGNAAAWGAPTATGNGTGAGINNPSLVTLGTAITLSANTTYGIALTLDNAHGHRYSGSGTNPAPGALSYSNADLSMSLGTAANVPFTGAGFTPRIFNGTIIYDITTSSVPYTVISGLPSGSVFPVGTTTNTLEYTDGGGNSVQCSFDVTVNDTEAPEIVCLGEPGNLTVTEDFEAATIPAGWSTEIITGAQDWTFGSGVMPGGDDFPTNAAIFDDDAAGSGQVNMARLLSPVYDITGATTAQLSFDYSVQDFVGEGNFEVEVYDGAAWQQILFIDDTDVAPVNSGVIDVAAFANAAFQVRFTYDDEGGWAWGAGIDNFNLSYEVPATNGLTVTLDANGMATINASDLILSATDNCGSVTVTTVGVPPVAGTIQTIFSSNNGGLNGGAVYFDITVGPNDINITDLDINTDEAGAFTMDVYTLVGTYVGNTGSSAAWGTPINASGTASGTIDTPSNAVLDNVLTLSAGTTYGMALVLDATHGHSYSGTGSDPSPGQLSYSNADLSLALGSASNVPFDGAPFTPRIFNGNINYTVGTAPMSTIDFDCSDLGESTIDIMVTDDSGNSSTCTATVNVVDNTPPVLVCQDTTIELGADGTATIDPMDLLASTPSTYNVMVIGSDNGSISEGFTDFTVNVTEAAAVSFDWDYTSNDDPGFDSFGYLLNGTYTQLTDPGLGNQSGSATVNVAPGDVFGFRSQTDDNLLGNNETVISNFMPGFTGQFDPANWNLTLTNSDGDAFFVEIPGGPLSFDACGITVLAVDVTEVSCADIGTPITVTVFASDASGNIASCTSIVTVVDNMGPEITCPADQTVDPGAGNLFYVVPDYFGTGEATVTDNCTDPVTVTSQDPAVGATLADGTYTVTLTAEDEYGNESTCSFELTVETVLGVNSNNLDAGVALYPNPATSIVNLVNKTNVSLEQMVIFDINGKQINKIDLRGMQGEKAVDVSSLASGVYMIQIIGDKSSTVKRLIIE